MTILEKFSGSSLYLDTNVLIYAGEGFERHQLVLAELISRVEGGDIDALTSEVTIMEALVRPLRKQNTSMIEYYEELLGPGSALRILPVDRQILRHAAELRAISEVKPIDAIHVVTAQVSQCDFLVSDDRKLKSESVRKISIEELAGG